VPVVLVVGAVDPDEFMPPIVLPEPVPLPEPMVLPEPIVLPEPVALPVPEVLLPAVEPELPRRP
jgi:hypothetical protein